MNILSIFVSTLAPVIFVIIPLFFMATALKLYRPIVKGWLGERKVRRILNGMDPRYTCFHDILFPINGDTTQIDHVVFVGNMCFVIETKSYAGWIFGNANDKSWTQMFNKRSKFDFQNPIRQNYKHILAVRELVGNMVVTGIVVFTQGTLKSNRIESVIYSKELKPYLLNNAKVDSVDNEGSIQALARMMITDRSAHREHVRKLQEKYGGRWRVLLANSLLVIACCLFFFRVEIIGVANSLTTQSYKTSRMAIESKYIPLLDNIPKRVQKTFTLNDTAFNQSLKQLPSALDQHQPEGQGNKVFLPTVNGFMKGKVVILSKHGHYQLLKIGGETEDGWTLLASDSIRATFLHSSGKTATIESR